MLKRHLSFLVQPLVRSPRQLRKADDLHAVVMVGDISDFKQSEAGYQRLSSKSSSVWRVWKRKGACSVRALQARLLAILEKTTD